MDRSRIPAGGIWRVHVAWLPPRDFVNAQPKRKPGEVPCSEGIRPPPASSSGAPLEALSGQKFLRPRSSLARNGFFAWEPFAQFLYSVCQKESANHFLRRLSPFSVIPAKAGTQIRNDLVDCVFPLGSPLVFPSALLWVPAFAGMTNRCVLRDTEDSFGQRLYMIEKITILDSLCSVSTCSRQSGDWRSQGETIFLER